MRWLAGRRKGRAPGEPSAIDPADAADIELRFAAVEADEVQERDRRLAATLETLVKRRVPIRAVEAVPAVGAARIRFADGTAVFARGVVPGDLGIVAMWVTQGSTAPSAFSNEAHGPQLVLRAPVGRRRLAVVVTGFDQPI